MRLGAQLLARLCRLPKQEFKIPNSDGVRRPLCKYRTRVKTCYKIKIGFRDFASRFSAVLLRL